MPRPTRDRRGPEPKVENTMRLLSLVVPMLTATLPTPALAEFQWASETRGIVQVYPNDSGLTFYLGGASLTPNGTCEQNRFHIGINDPNYEVKASAITSAFMGGMNVRINHDIDAIACSTPVSRFIVSP